MGGEPAELAQRALAEDERKIKLFSRDKFENIKLRDLFERSKGISGEFCFVSEPEKD
jgi:hypothetical protein